MLLNIKDDVECFLIDLGRLKGLNMGKVFSCLVFASVFALWMSRLQKIGFYSVNILFPVMTVPFKLIYSKSKDHPFWLAVRVNIC